MAKRVGTGSRLTDHLQEDHTTLLEFPTTSESIHVARYDSRGFAAFAGLKNTSSVKYDEAVYSLNSTQSGCYANGSLPVPLSSNDTCNLGFYCPASSDQEPPQYCPPSYKCAIVRANQGTCEAQGTLEPHRCQEGFYCPEGGKQKIICPKRDFCPPGSFEPFRCDIGAKCPEGSSRQIPLAPLVVIIIIDVFLLILIFVGFAIAAWRKRNKEAKYTYLGSSPHVDDVEALKDVPFFASATPLSEQGQSLKPVISSLALRPISVQLSPLPPPRRFRAQSTASSMTAIMYDDLQKTDELELVSPEMQRFLEYLSRAIETKDYGLSFEFEKLAFKTSKGKTILRDVTGCMPKGTMWGVMGGSGAGKSTFVNVLMGKHRASSGVVRINGGLKDMSKYKKLIGYVPQDDIVLSELTVRENILHSARMRLPYVWKDNMIQDFVDSLIACLALSHVQHSLVGDATKPVISGGQRKRVSIGVELAAAPMAIFLDEPTSGLDATSAASVMKLLKAVSSLGVTVISIIHQPREDIWSAFDQLLLLAQGRQAYAGRTDEVVPYFEGMGYHFPVRSNPADVIMDIISGDGAQYSVTTERSNDVTPILDDWQNKGQYHQRKSQLSLSNPGYKEARSIADDASLSSADQEEQLHRTMKARGATWVAQVYYCCKRALTQQVRNRTSFLFEIGVGAVAGIVIGLSAASSKGNLFQGIFQPPFTLLSSAVDYKSVPELGLLSAMAIGLAASAPGVWAFGEEKMIYYREAASGHSRSAYYLGKVISTIPRIALSALHYSVLQIILATPLMSFGHMYAANLTYWYAIYGGASLVSMLVKREDGPLLAVLASLILGVLGGVAPPLSRVKEWHAEWFWRLSPAVWFTEAYWTQNLAPLKHLYVLELANEAVGFNMGNFALDLGMIMLIGTVYRIFAYFLLILMHRSKQR